jgi:hypothetical protein
VSKRNPNIERISRRKRTVALRESPTEPSPDAPVVDADGLAPFSPADASVNGDDETALARLDDDGAPASAAEANPLPPVTVSKPSATLEERVRRLEDTLDSLQARLAVEPRIVPSPPPALPADPLPAAPAQPPPTAILVDVGKRLFAAAAPSVAPSPIVVPNVSQSAMRGGLLWLLWDTWAEARSIVRMFVDPRYQMPRSTRFLPLLLLAAILTSYYWIPGTSIPVIGSWINKVFDLLLAFVLIKWLGHEARRYRRTSPDLPPNLRL